MKVLTLGDKKAVIKKSELGFSCRVLKGKFTPEGTIWILLKFKAGMKSEEVAKAWGNKILNERHKQ